jgi:hypothetical protein
VLGSYVIGMLAIVVMAVVWVGVQSAWRKAFPEVCSDPDVLAGRLGCHGCDSTDNCERRLSEEPARPRRESHE